MSIAASRSSLTSHFDDHATGQPAPAQAKERFATAALTQQVFRPPR